MAPCKNYHMIVEDEAKILQGRRPGTEDNEIFEYTRAPFLNSTLCIAEGERRFKWAFRYGSLLAIPPLEGVVDNPFPKH